jgi:hypothetical protein
MNGNEYSYLRYVEFKKTFDLLAMDVIWQVLEDYKVAKKTVSTIKSLYMKDLSVVLSIKGS